MAIKVGINGFGRIGRVVLRIMSEHPEKFDICGINLRKADLDYMVYLVKYDSVFRQFNGTVEQDGENLILNGHKIHVFSESDASQIKWADYGVEYVIESTGVYATTEKASAHFVGGAKKVILTAPAKDEETPTFVMGVNHELLRPDMKVVSNASCTTNCLAPLAKVINDEFGIERALMSTIHASTSKQMTGMSFRVPTADVSVVDLTAQLKKPATYQEICEAIHRASEGSLKGILAYTRDQIVSQDLVANPHPSIFDETAGIMLDDNFVKLISWYDNEWGYSSMVVRLLEHMASIDK